MAQTSESPADTGRLVDLEEAADHARRRYELYKARAYSSRPTSPGRLRNLERDSERAASALNRARANA